MHNKEDIVVKTQKVVLIDDILTEGPKYNFIYSKDDVFTLPRGSIGEVLSMTNGEYLVEFEENILVSLKENQLEDIKIFNLKERIAKLKKI
jgi:hypothetical protein